MAQFLRPDGDVSANGWSPTPLYAEIDEVTASDADLISAIPNTDGDAEMTLSSPATTPSVDTGHIVRWRMRANKTNKPGQLAVAIYQGTTLIREDTYDAQADLTTAFADYSYTLTTGEAGNITDYTDLQIHFNQTLATAGNFFDVSWMEMEVPDGSTTHEAIASVSLVVNALTIPAEVERNASATETLALTTSTPVAYRDVQRTASENLTLTTNAVAIVEALQLGADRTRRTHKRSHRCSVRRLGRYGICGV